MEELYSIGETAKMNNVSIKSLRHYDEICLFKPRHIDPETGYRYYAYSQFSFIDKIGVGASDSGDTAGCGLADGVL